MNSPGVMPRKEVTCSKTMLLPEWFRVTFQRSCPFELESQVAPDWPHRCSLCSKASFEFLILLPPSFEYRDYWPFVTPRYLLVVVFYSLCNSDDLTLICG